MFSGPSATRVQSSSTPSSPATSASHDTLQADPPSLSLSTSSFPSSTSAPITPMTNASPPKFSLLHSPPQQRSPSLNQSNYNSPKPERQVFAENSNSPRLQPDTLRHLPDLATQVLDPLRSRTEIHNPDLTPDYAFRTASPRGIDTSHKDTLSHLHEKMASTLPKSATSPIISGVSPTSSNPISERSVSYSEISLKHSDSANLQLHFKHVDDRPDEAGSPWEDGSSLRVSKTRRETDLSKR